MGSWSRAARRRALITVFLVVVVFGWPLSRAGAALVVGHPLANPDAVVSLGSHEWERLPEAARLAAGAPAAVVLLTEPRRLTPANCHLCAQRVAWLGALGLPAGRVVVLPTRVGNTRDEAVAVAEYAKHYPIRRLVVVTSPYHTRRAAAVFAAVLGGQVEIGVQPAAGSPARPGRWWTQPYDRAYVAYEWTALAWYALRHGINPVVPFETVPFETVAVRQVGEP
jgi:uncharacterized SAM-binding protein YcdF (DUF218 family)